MSPLADVGLFLFHSLATLYLVVLLLRFALPLVRADFRNPVCQFVHRATWPLLAPLRRFVPGLGRLDPSPLLAALFVEWLAIQLAASLVYDAGLLDPLRVLLWGALGLLSLALSCYYYGVLAVVILSWVAPHSGHPAARLLWRLMEPVMAPFRRILPPLAGVDLSPILLFVVLNMFRILLGHAARAAQVPAGIVPGI
ncbi:MAG: membrane protein [Porticoccaceae bacterium]|nr:MAG: membrane protein [Porticoccaceae bacterium]